MDDSAAELLLMFQKMGTSDRSELVRQFQAIVPGVADEICKFFLEANNWTLQNALISFFEESGGADMAKQIKVLSTPKPHMGFLLKDEPHTVMCNQRFIKLMHLHNTGPTAWPSTVTLEHVHGDRFGAPSSIRVGGLQPNQGLDIPLELTAPNSAGEYAGSWMCCTNGDVSMMFGEAIWIIVRVEANFNQTPQAPWGSAGIPNHNNNNSNPFGGVPQQVQPQAPTFNQATFNFNPQFSAPMQQPNSQGFGSMFQQQMQQRSVNPFQFGTTNQPNSSSMDL